MDLSNAFYSSSDSAETLSLRNTLLKEQVENARQEKDLVLDYLKTNVGDRLGIPVKYWIQGSFKNHTVIRPVRKSEEFDIDVGLYLLGDAEAIGVAAKEAKSALRSVLLEYCKNHGAAQIAESKPNCERICYELGFHIDLPLYYVSGDGRRCRLATNEKGWINSDPKALQGWFDAKITHLSDTEKAQLRRVIKALKTWVCLKEITLPSIAVTVFVAENFGSYSTEQEAVWSIAYSLTGHLIKGGKILSPINGDDLINANSDQMAELKSNCVKVQKALSEIACAPNTITCHQLWSLIFEHAFPPLATLDLEGEGTINLPAVTKTPKISVKYSDGAPAQLTEVVNVSKGTQLSFRIHNLTDYPSGSYVVWMVRNTDRDASFANDLGHKTHYELSATCKENCEYQGTHYMECTVLNNGLVLGVSAVRVRIRGHERALRNPPRKKYGPVRR